MLNCVIGYITVPRSFSAHKIFLGWSNPFGRYGSSV